MRRAPVIAAVAVATSLLPVTFGALAWARSGGASRGGFALARSLERVGVVDTPGRRVLFVAVFLLPALAGATLLAVGLDRPRAAGAAAALAGVVGVTAAAVGWRGGLREPGVVGTVLAAGTALLGGLYLFARPEENDV